MNENCKKGIHSLVLVEETDDHKLYECMYCTYEYRVNKSSK
jgi:hypothetical protein